jgi:hypothetical protein
MCFQQHDPGGGAGSDMPNRMNQFADTFFSFFNGRAIFNLKKSGIFIISAGW